MATDEEIDRYRCNFTMRYIQGIMLRSLPTEAEPHVGIRSEVEEKTFSMIENMRAYSGVHLKALAEDPIFIAMNPYGFVVPDGTLSAEEQICSRQQQIKEGGILTDDFVEGIIVGVAFSKGSTLGM